MLSGFKQFILRGNVVDLAVGVVIGAAFGSVVTALTKDLLTPIITLLSGKATDFSSIKYGPFLVGDFINSLISFLLIAAAVYFFVVTPVNALMNRFGKPAPTPVTTKKCPQCAMDIPLEANRCGHCTQPVSSGAAAA
jgi:large conductance mechanosensitive channel